DILTSLVVTEDRDLGCLAKLANRRDGIEAAEAGQAEIHDGNGGSMLAVHPDAAGSVARFRYQRYVAASVQDRAQGHAREKMIFNQKHPDGHRVILPAFAYEKARGPISRCHCRLMFLLEDCRPACGHVP